MGQVWRARDLLSCAIRSGGEIVGDSPRAESSRGRWTSPRSTTKGVDEHLKNHPGDGAGHLHFVYWQQTAGVFGEKDIYKTTSAARKDGKWTGGAHANLDDLVAELQERRKMSANRLPINVLSHDFVTADTCRKIIGLNPDLP